MRSRVSFICSAVIALSGAWAGTAHAAVIYDNLAFPSTFSDSVRSVNPTNGQPSDGPLADSFSTGAAAFTLPGVKVLVQRESRNASNGHVTVSLFADSGSNSPGSLLSILGTFSDTQLTRKPSIIDLSQTIGIGLNPFTRYWIGLSTTDNSRAGWAAAGGDKSGSTYGTAPDQFGVGGLGEYFYAAGAIAQGYGTDVFQNGPSPYYPYEMQVSGTLSPVPLPSALPLFAFGLLGMGLLAHRRGRTQAEA